MANIAVLIDGGTLDPFLRFLEPSSFASHDLTLILSHSFLVEELNDYDVVCFAKPSTLVPVNWVPRVAITALEHRAAVIPLHLVDRLYGEYPPIEVDVGLEGVLSFNNMNSLLEVTQAGLIEAHKIELNKWIEGMCIPVKGFESVLIQTHCGVVPSYVEGKSILFNEA